MDSVDNINSDFSWDDGSCSDKNSGPQTDKTIRYIENKPLDLTRVESLLNTSARANHWSNFGPLSKQLEQELADVLALDTDLRVVACCSATAALHGLIALYHTQADKPLRWATSAFGFYSSVDGILSEAAIVDCDQQAMLDLDLIDPQTIDGLIVTNVFGQAQSLEKYRQFALTHNKLLIIDSAMGLQAGGHIANECISLHHTKPWGFGEGGCAIVHKDNEAFFREMISFGHAEPGAPIYRLAANGKISEVACAFLLMRLEQMRQLSNLYRQQYQRICNIGKDLGLQVLADCHDHPGVPSNVPFLLPNPIADIECGSFPVKRYYHPLADTRQACEIYNRIVNIPCHPDMTTYTDRAIESILSTLLSRSQAS